MIQTGTVEMYHKYAYALAERDAHLNNLLMVDIGGGLNPRNGYVTIDKEDANILCDLNDGIPLADNSVGVLNASHILEHLKDPYKSMSEIHRVLVDGGWAFIDVPSTDGRGAFQDPTHVSYWNQNSFLYYTHKEQAGYIRNKNIHFQQFRCETMFPNDWYKNMNVPVVRVILSALKSETRRPHPRLL
jgi:SAM-dependent methyltransferase